MNTSEAGSLAGAVGSRAALALAQNPTTIPGDGAIPIDIDGTYLLTKGSAAAITVAAPGAANIGRKLVIMGGSDFAHVVTFTGSTLRDGTTGGSAAWTSAAFQGSSLTCQAVSAVLWNVIANNLGVIA
jgi:hypothetical protein